MSSVVNGSNVGLEICKVLGLNDQYVKSVTIDIQPEDVVRITVIHLMSVDQSETLLEVLKKYHMVDDSEEDGKR